MAGEGLQEFGALEKLKNGGVGVANLSDVWERTSGFTEEKQHCNP